MDTNRIQNAPVPDVQHWLRQDTKCKLLYLNIYLDIVVKNKLFLMLKMFCFIVKYIRYLSQSYLMFLVLLIIIF